MTGEINANWKHPYSAYDLSKILYEDKTRDYEEFSRVMRENFISLENRIALIESRVQTIWDTVFP